MIDNNNPLVSIGIPTYNRADGFLRQALTSALNQTYDNIEIIVSDNCSTDDTDVLVNSFGDDHIRYYKHKENIGANNNFNYCLNQSKGKYFLLLHDDDLIDKDLIEVCVNTAGDNHEAGVILTGAREIDFDCNVLRENNNSIEGQSTVEFYLSWFDGKVPLYLCSTLFNTERLKELGGFNSKTNLYNDVVAYVQLAAKYGRIDVYDIKASYRRHGENMAASDNVLEWCEDSLYVLDIMCKMVPEHSTLIRDRGMTYFCRRNYLHATRIKSPLHRFLTYLKVYNMFNRSYSPYKFIYSRNISSRQSALKRKIRELFN